MTFVLISPGPNKKAATPACVGMTASVYTVSPRAHRPNLGGGLLFLDLQLLAKLNLLCCYLRTHGQSILNPELLDLSVAKLRAIMY